MKVLKKKNFVTMYFCILVLFSQAQNQTLNSNFSEIFTLDSIVSYALDINSILFRVGKSEFKYDASGRITFQTIYSRIGSEYKMEGTSQRATEFNNNGLVTQTKNFKWELNSSQWIDDELNNTEYNEFKQMISRTNLKWNVALQAWEKSSKNDYEYDIYQRNTLNSFSQWNKTRQQWEITYKDETIFDSEGNANRNEYYLSTPGGALELRYKTTQIFDEQKNLTMQTKMRYDNNLKQWVGDGKLENSFDISGNITQKITYNWDIAMKEWVYKEKYEYQFNSKGIQTLMSHSLYAADKFYLKDKIETVFDFAGQLIRFSTWGSGSATKAPSGTLQYTCEYENNRTQSKINFAWDFVKNVFVNSSKYEYFYDDNGNLSKYNNYTWNTLSSSFELNSKTDFSSLNNGNLVISTNTSFRQDNWTNFSKNEKEYNNVYTKEQLFYPSQYEGFFDHMFLSDTHFKWDGTWKKTNQTCFYFSKADFTPVINNEQTILKVYPNPASDLITVQLFNSDKSGTIELFDNTGKKVISEIARNTKQLDINHIPPGIYIYRIKLNQEIKTGKIIIQ